MIRRRLAALLAVVALLLPLPAGAAPDYYKILLPQTTIAAAVTGVVTDPVLLGQIPNNATYFSLQALFNYGSGGTTAKAWVQTSFDGGTTWCDIVNFAFTTAAGTKVGAVSASVAAAAPAACTDATLADNTMNNGLIGDRIRLKYTTTGTYGGATNLKVTVVPR